MLSHLLGTESCVQVIILHRHELFYAIELKLINKHYKTIENTLMWELILTHHLEHRKLHY